jgi:hypothetical protein
METTVITPLLLSYSLVSAQSSTFSFGHDEAGNWNFRTLVLPPEQFHPRDTTTHETSQDSLVGHGIKIFPNPTIGVFEVDILSIVSGGLAESKSSIF